MKRRANSKIIALILILSMTISTVTVYGATPKEVEFTYRSSFNDAEFSSVLYYTDDYFTGSATNVNKHLMTASLALELAASNTTTGNVQQTLPMMGFGDIQSQDYSTNSYATIGTVVSSKKLEDDTLLVAVQVRGAYYGYEWGQNFITGKTGDADGYKYPAEKVCKFVNRYINQHRKDARKVKIWITGYSRGGSVANLAAKTFSDQYGKKNVYAYCFDAPKVSVTYFQKYDNIHNFQNKDDALPYFLPCYMGFIRNGDKPHLLATGDEDRMRAILNGLVGEAVVEEYYKPLKDFNWTKFKLNINLASITTISDIIKVILGCKKLYDFDEGGEATVDELMKLAEQRLRYAIPTRKEYVEGGMQDALTAVGILSQALTPAQMNDLLELLKDKETILMLVSDINLFRAVREIQRCGCPRLTDSQYRSIANTVNEALVNRSNLTRAQKKFARTAVKGLIKPLIRYLAVDYNSDKQTLGTLISNNNIMKMVQCHYLDVNLAWAMSEDTYYQGN